MRLNDRPSRPPKNLSFWPCTSRFLIACEIEIKFYEAKKLWRSLKFINCAHDSFKTKITDNKQRNNWIAQHILWAGFNKSCGWIKKIQVALQRMNPLGFKGPMTFSFSATLRTDRNRSVPMRDASSLLVFDRQESHYSDSGWFTNIFQIWTWTLGTGSRNPAVCFPRVSLWNRDVSFLCSLKHNKAKKVTVLRITAVSPWH